MNKDLNLSQMENTEKKVFKMLISWYNSRNILEISSELTNINLVARFNIVPTPDKFIKCFFFTLFLANYFRMPGCIINFSNLFKGYF
jgi:hypothetical protein